MIQNTGQFIAEVLKAFPDDKYIVKTVNGSRYLVHCKKAIDKTKLKVGTRVALDFTTLTIMRILPHQIDPRVYNMMTEEYRNKRFGNLDNYKQYIKDNYDEFKGINASAYLTKNTDNAVQYVIKDQYQNLYIFDVKSTMNYTIKLDTYTIEEENFTTTYAGADESQRVQMNIGKFFDMINRHDYITSYRCLDDTFKKNNMKSQQEFENTIKNSLFKFNKYELNELKSIGSKTYECQLYVSDSIDSASDRIKMTIIMQLQEDRNFVMSFSMN
jgi:hypothetical protein